MSKDLCMTCKYADWRHGEWGGCTHAILEECEDCIECDTENRGYIENKWGEVITCCMYEEDKSLDNDNPENYKR